MEFDESLPSQSSFQPANDTINTTRFRSTTSNRVRAPAPAFKTNIVRDSRAESPPPPPPSTNDDFNHTHQYQNKQSNISNSFSSSLNEFGTDKFQQSPDAKSSKKVEKPVNGAKFTFLKKGSRVEPSALNKSNPSSPSPSTDTSSKFNLTADRKSTSFSSTGRVNHGLGFDQSAVTARVQTFSSSYANDHRQFDEDGEEIVLSGGDYWTGGGGGGADTRKSASRPTTANHVHSRVDPVRNSTVSITGDDWRQAMTRHSSIQAAQKEDLDEFESLEQQLSDMNPGGGALDTSQKHQQQETPVSQYSAHSRSSSSQFNGHRSTDVEPDFEGDEDSDALGRSTVVHLKDRHSDKNSGQTALRPNSSSSSASRPQFTSYDHEHEEEDDDEDRPHHERFDGRHAYSDEDDDVLRVTTTTTVPVHLYDEEEEGEEENVSHVRENFRESSQFDHTERARHSQSNSRPPVTRHSSDFDQYDPDLALNREASAARSDPRRQQQADFSDSNSAWGATTQPARHGRPDPQLENGFRASSAYPDHHHDPDRSVNSSINDISGISGHHNQSGNHSSINSQHPFGSTGGVKLAGSLARKLGGQQRAGTGGATPSGRPNVAHSSNFQEEQQQQQEEEENDGFNDNVHSNNNSNNTTRSSQNNLHQNNSVSNNNNNGAVRTTRPVSSLRTETPPTTGANKSAQNHHTNNLSSSHNSSSNVNANANSNNASSSAPLPAALVEKARDLEAELERYRSENASLVRLRKQQEVALKEVVTQKEETLKWAAEERQRVTLWCDQQKALANKERKAAAKQASEARLTANIVPIRKEKAEIEALTATVEKMRLEHEAAAKKSRVNEGRLNGLFKEHSTHIEFQDRMLNEVEEHKLLLLEFISQNELRIPRALRAKLERGGGAEAPVASSTRGVTPNRSGTRSGGGSTTSSHHPRYAGERGYVEEVDVQMVQSSSRTIPAHSASGRHGEYGSYGDDAEDDDYSEHRQGGLRSNVDDGGRHQVPAAASSSRPSSARKNVAAGGQSGKAATMAAQSRAQTQTALRPSPAVTTTTSVDLDLSGRPSSRGNTSSKRDLNSSSRGSGALTASNTTASWARTSRSSASRYSSAGSDAEEGEEDRAQEADSHDLQMARFGTARGVAASPPQQVKTQSHVHPPALSISTSRNGPPSVGPGSSVPVTPNGGGSVDSGSNRVEEVLPDGTRHITYRNGTRKNVFLNGDSEVLFVNGDSKHVTAASGVVVYYYDQAQTTHTTFPDGKEVYEFPNKQIEKHFPDGTKEIEFPDQTRKVIYPDDVQESHFPDGVILREYPDGHKEVVTDEGPYRGSGRDGYY